MTLGFAIRVMFEIAAILLIAYGYKNEERLIAFESELFAVMKFVFKKYVLKQTRNNTVNSNTKPSEHNINYSSSKIRKFPSQISRKNVA